MPRYPNNDVPMRSRVLNFVPLAFRQRFAGRQLTMRAQVFPMPASSQEEKAAGRSNMGSFSGSQRR